MLQITNEELIERLKTQLAKALILANKWRELDAAIGAFYEKNDDEHDEEGGDLIAIGEIAARAFGYL